MHLPGYVLCFVPKLQAVKVAVELRSRQKKGGFGARFVWGGDTPDFGQTFSNRTHFRACGRFWLSSIQQARRVADKKQEERRKKGKSAVVGRQLCQAA